MVGALASANPRVGARERIRKLEESLRGRPISEKNERKLRILRRIHTNFERTERVENMSTSQRNVFTSNSINLSTLEADKIFKKADPEEQSRMINREMDESGYLSVIYEKLGSRKFAQLVEELNIFSDKFGEEAVRRLEVLSPGSSFINAEWLLAVSEEDDQVRSDFESRYECAPGSLTRILTVIRYLNSFDSAEKLNDFFDQTDCQWPAKVHPAGSRIRALGAAIAEGRIDDFLQDLKKAKEEAEEESQRLKAEQSERMARLDEERREFLKLFEEMAADGALQEVFVSIPSRWNASNCIGNIDNLEDLISLVRRRGFRDRLLHYWDRLAQTKTKKELKRFDPHSRRQTDLGIQLMAFISAKRYRDGELNDSELGTILSKFGFTDISIGSTRVGMKYGTSKFQLSLDGLERKLYLVHRYMAEASIRMASLLRTEFNKNKKYIRSV